MEKAKRNWKKIIIRNVLSFVITVGVIVVIIYSINYFGR